MNINIGVTVDGELQLYEFRHPRITVGKNPLNDIVLEAAGAIGLEGEFIGHTEDNLTYLCSFHPSREAAGRWVLTRGDTSHPVTEVVVLKPGDKLYLKDYVGIVLQLQQLQSSLPSDEFKVLREPLNELEDEHFAQFARAAQESLWASTLGEVFSQISALFKAQMPQITHLSLVRETDDEDLFQRLVCTEGQFTDNEDIKSLCQKRVRSALEASSGAILYRDLEEGTWVALSQVEIPTPGKRTYLAARLQRRPPHDMLHNQAMLTRLVSPLVFNTLRLQKLYEERDALVEENRYFRERERRHYLFKEIVCESPSMRHVFTRMSGLVSLNQPVLITGEAGTGKELMARALHHLGPRADKMLISQKCGDLDEQVLDLELFGFARDTHPDVIAPRQGLIELVNGGTLFLDEIDLLSAPIQSKILRVLKEGEVRRIGGTIARTIDVRFISSTNRDLAEMAKQGHFRLDLYMNISKNQLEIPPLRMRREDIMPLANTFLGIYKKRYGKPNLSFSSDIEDRLVSYDWPGNVRELQGVIETVVIKTKWDSIRAHQIPIE